ncbi:hypothetical protein Pyrfu_1524 [Pyrolobus fumarii 1A]|uniref:Replication initiator protein WhiP n=1 Tax=Pyrolobus fumarii (strain DSM 11204 / 1A) TaxID=694429 RepID=G0EHM8_PYRF1|nr:hypothetical protein [Pyrolobus fumarii]AEM39381.1 hypothetical protein Pyrfu_1524 [Pyrolobus fumarii 1A]
MNDKELQRIAEILATQLAEKEKRKKMTRIGPRSRIVEAIAVLLYSRPMRAAEIAQILGFTSRYISSYLSYWKTRGLFEYENGYWRLTPLGEEFAREVLQRYTDSQLDRYAILARQILAAPTTPAINDKTAYHPHGQYRNSLPFIAERISIVDNERQRREFCARQLYSIYEPNLDEEEKEVLKAILDHYSTWGKTYLYIDQLQERLSADHHWLLSTLRKLQAKDLIYIYHDRRMGARIGLSKQARRVIDDCLESHQLHSHS